MDDESGSAFRTVLPDKAMDNGAFRRMPLPTHNDVLAERILYGGGKYAVQHPNPVYGLVPGLSDVAKKATQRNDSDIVSLLRALGFIDGGQ
jgi:hypothetical protein